VPKKEEKKHVNKSEEQIQNFIAIHTLKTEHKPWPSMVVG
jgi:hypothetical protein